MQTNWREKEAGSACNSIIYVTPYLSSAAETEK
jgi:hypothetical protein